MQILDLRFDADITLKIDEGVSYKPSISGIRTLDTEYTFSCNDIVKTVANGGITLVNNSIIINIDENDFPRGHYKGCLESNSKIAGIYKYFKIEIISYGVVSC
jgi:hypothetical protein